MKAKYIIIAFVCSITLTGSMSCKKYLDKEPLDALSNGSFWTTEGDVKMALTGVYARLRSGYFGFRRMWLDTYSDNGYDRHNFYNFQNLTVGVVNPTSAPSDFYNPPYQGIASANFFLANVDKAPVSEVNKKLYIAEVRFLRALFYFDLVTAYGGVVIYTKPPENVDVSKIKQSTKDEVLSLIHQDLDFAVSNLPDTKYEGHAVKGSAMALKTRVLLSQEKWADAAALAKQIIDGGKFSLAPSYSGLFITSTQVGNPEIMFSTDFLSPNNYHRDFGGADVEIGWWGAIGVYKDLGEDYEMLNGKKITDPGSGYDPNKMALNRDPRFDMTLKYPGEKFTNPDGTEFFYTDPALTPYVMQKYVNLSRLPLGYDKANLTDQHIIHLRYADVLLMYAEAKNEVEGPSAGVYAALNAIRARPSVNMPPIDQTVYNSQAALREGIRHERRIELAMEGLRYFDLKRWKVFETKLANVANPGGVKLKFGEKNYVLPFPQSEIDRNPKLVQNQGY
jgi:hypothetical protein